MKRWVSHDPTGSVSTSLTIDSLEAIPVRVRRGERFRPKTAHGEVTASEYVIVILRAGGSVGIGEVTCSPTWNGENALATVELVRKELAPLITGRDPFNWNAVGSLIDSVLNERRPFLRAGIEMACLDVTGQHLGISASSFIGGPVRHRIATKIVLPARAPELVADLASEAVARGAGVIKVKVGLDPEDDVKRVASVRNAIDDRPIIVDANEGWNAETVRRVVPQLLGLGVVAFEQPMPRHELEAMAVIRQETGAVFVADESVWTWSDLSRVARSGAFDMVSLYPGKCGGIRRFTAMCEAALAMGLEVTIGSNLELGVGTAALAQAAAAVPVLSDLVPSDVIGPLYFEESLVIDCSFVSWGYADVPGATGLGVTLAEEEVRSRSFAT